MKFWTALRTAYTLAERVGEMEKTVRELTYEWGDLNDKLLAREERLRKRLSRDLARAVTEDTAKESVAPTPQSERKAQIQKEWRQRRGA